FGMSGRIFHAPFVNSHPAFQLYAVTERHQKRAGTIYAEVKSFDTPDEMINDPELQLVIVNTPNNAHFEYAKQALAAKKHVLIEKPFTATPAEAEELFALADQSGCYVLPYQNRRWDSDFLSVKQVIDGGK